MAQRDRSQGFAFMYVDISKLLKQRDELKNTEIPVATATAPVINLNRDKPAIVQNDSLALNQDRQLSLKMIKDNLDRLQSLHHKLHAMLEELNKITIHEKKSKPN